MAWESINLLCSAVLPGAELVVNLQITLEISLDLRCNYLDY
jgi:hypothetical protein